MGDVVEFKKTDIKKAYEGDYDFLFCICQNDKKEPDQTFHPMVCSDVNGQIVCGFFCHECESVITVINGRIGELINENA